MDPWYYCCVIDVVIPTKSYVEGLSRILGQLATDSGVNSIVVVADGYKALETMGALGLPPNARLVAVPLGVGIHVMWNLGMDIVVRNGNHIAFINDDTTISPNCMQVVSDLLDRRPDIGLVTPNYTSHAVPEFQEMVKHGGFCMTLARDLCPEWRFDERMKWWYGDDDIQQWTHRAKGRKVGLTGLSTCGDNCSYTIGNDGPEGFHQLVENDRLLFIEKWG